MTRGMGRQAMMSAALAGVFWLASSEPVSAAMGSVGVQVTGSDVMDRAADDYRFGPGFNISGTVPLARRIDVRADFGVRFLEGEQTSQGANPAPDLGARPGERTDGLRVMPFTVDVAYRFEQWSKERFWLPFAAAGLGFYDMEARYLPEDPNAQTGPDEDVVRKKNLYAFGWNAKAGVQLHRTSGLFVNLESGIHLINTDRRWTPMCDLSIGIGTILPRE